MAVSQEIGLFTKAITLLDWLVSKDRESRHIFKMEALSKKKITETRKSSMSWSLPSSPCRNWGCEMINFQRSVAFEFEPQFPVWPFWWLCQEFPLWKPWFYFLNCVVCIGVQPINNVCDSFRWTGKWLSHTHTCIHSPPNPPPTQAATEHWAEFPVLDSRSLLENHNFK